ncbi:MAG: TonB-dependent receptor domain-containing protein [Fidelibacterota bacterium]
MSIPSIRILALAIAGIVSLIAAQDHGTLSGRITDQDSQHPLIGANVFITGTSLGAATDYDGYYSISGIPAGTYSMKVTYMGYEKAGRTLVMTAGEQKHINVQLAPAIIQSSEVTVAADTKRDNELSAFARRQESVEIQNNISATQMARAGDSNVAAALRRVTGVTVMDDRYLVVRGLGNRYSSAQLNAVSMPSPEPEKRAVPLDIFSTAIIEAIDVTKSYRPDLPGTFGGGNVNIKTKVYPDRTIYRVKIGASVNSNIVPGSVFIRNMGGSMDKLGFDKGVRDLPSGFGDKEVNLACCPPDFAENLLDDYTWTFDTTTTVFGIRIDSMQVPNPDSLAYREYLWKTLNYPTNRRFARVFSQKNSQSGLPASVGLTYGTKYELTSDLEAGYMIDGNFSSRYTHHHENQVRYAAKMQGINDSSRILIPDDIQLDRNQYQYSTNLGISASTGISFRDALKISFRSIFTHTSKDVYNMFLGRSGEIDESGLFINQLYHEKSINLNTLTYNQQLTGKKFTHDIEANYTFGKSILYEPYAIKHQYQKDESVGLYKVYARNAVDPAELYSSMGYEDSRTVAYDHTITSQRGKIKLGLKHDRKQRTFSRRLLVIDYSSDLIRNDSALNYIRDEFHAGTQFNQLAGVDRDGIHEGYLFSERTATGKGTKNTDAYRASETIAAGYLMFSKDDLFRDKVQIRFGVRNEIYSLTMSPHHPVTGYRPFYTTRHEDQSMDTTYIEFAKCENDFLPAFIVNYNVTDKLKLRQSYSRTVARAQFREYAPYEYQPFFLANVAIGFPFLKNTKIQNMDIRLDYTPQGMDIISLGLYQKHFRHPIEESIVAGFGRSYYQTWQNAKSARLSGLEFEYRKHLNVIPARYGFITINSNLTLSRSEVNAPDSSALYIVAEGNSAPDIVKIYNRVTDKSRPLQGQSNLVFNLSLNFITRSGLDLNLVYNTFSRRLLALSGDVAGSYWELPFQSMNIVLHKKLGPVRLSLKIKNLLNDSVVIAHNYQGKIYPTRTYNPGRDFSVGISFYR